MEGMAAAGLIPGVSGPNLFSGNELDGLNNQVEQFYKAIQAGYGTDHASLSGGAALRRESLEATLLTVVQRTKHFVFWNKCPGSKATATVDEFSIQSAIGGFPGGAFNGELEDIQEASGEYDRKTLLMKYMMTKGRVSVVAEVQSQNGLQDAMVVEERNRTLELLTSANWGCYYGDSSCNPREFDGLYALLKANGTDDSILDLRGQPPSAVAKEFVDSAALVWGYGRWGMLDNSFHSALVQADIDQKLDPAFRVVLNGNTGSIRLGAPVDAIKTSFGTINMNVDPFIQEGQPPFNNRGPEFVANVSNAGLVAPATVAGNSAPTPGSQFAAGQNGNYYYGAEAGNKNGRSAFVKSGQVAVAVGDGVTVTITHGVNDVSTYFQVYRSRRNGTNDDSDFREMLRVPKANAATTVIVDLNADIPGTSMIFLTTMIDDAVTFRRFLPMTRFPLYPTTRAEHVWAQLLFGALRLGKPQQHRVIKNVLAQGQPWRPF